MRVIMKNVFFNIKYKWNSDKSTGDVKEETWTQST